MTCRTSHHLFFPVPVTRISNSPEKIAELNLQSTGNADIEAGNLAADKIILSSNGNADIEVSTKELVEKEIKGNNDITNLYYASKKNGNK